MIDSPPRLPMPEAYARWQERLTTAFFTGHEQQPVVLFVDRDELDQLCESGQDGARSLATAVRQVIDVTSTTHMFRKVLALQDAWLARGTAGPPPTLPILALSVLAASEMRRDGTHNSNAYYIRLAEAALPDGTDDEVRMLRQRLREGHAFLPVVSMWEYLALWLQEAGGVYGTSTIRGHSHDKRRGYPLSQTLVRRGERAALTRFFAQADIRPGAVPSADALVRTLERWMRYRAHGLSQHFETALRDQELRPFVAQLVHDLASVWDGKIITPEGLRPLDIRLAVDLDDALAWWVIPAARDLTGDILRGASGVARFEAVITTDPHSSMYRTDGLPPVTSVALADGLSARGEHSVAAFEPRQVLVLMGNADAGGWVSVDAIRPYEEHVLVVTAEVASTVATTLTDTADGGWRQLPSAFGHKLLGPGFAVFDRLMFSDQERLDALLNRLPGTVAAGMRLGATLRPKLINGLPLMRKISRHLYLAGGEPDILLPFDEVPRDVDVELDGVLGTLRASLMPVPIHGFIGGFTDGSHSVEAEGETLTFEVAHTSDDDRPSAGVGTIGWNGGRLEHTLETEICGAETHGERHETPLLARRGSIESWLIHRTGSMTRLEDPPEPTALAGLRFTRFEVDPGGAAWLVQKRPRGWQCIRLQAQEPTFRHLTSDEQRVWAELAAGVHVDDPIWPLYCRAWERARGR